MRHPTGSVVSPTASSRPREARGLGLRPEYNFLPSPAHRNDRSHGEEGAARRSEKGSSSKVSKESQVRQAAGTTNEND